MDTPRRTLLFSTPDPGLYYHPLHLSSRRLLPLPMCGSLPPWLIACRPNCHAPDAYWNMAYPPDAYRNPYPTFVPRPPKARNRGRKRGRNNNSSPQSPAQNASTSNLKRTRTHVDDERPAKRARTRSSPSEDDHTDREQHTTGARCNCGQTSATGSDASAASTGRATPLVDVTNERAEFASVTGGRGGNGGSAGVNGGNGGIGTGPINMHVYIGTRSSPSPGPRFGYATPLQSVINVTSSSSRESGHSPGDASAYRVVLLPICSPLDRQDDIDTQSLQ
ncbi:hypothetical protein C8R45DRAFT_1021748 [Mycena sanguinolenta]|nr:hypothetical protein C8R45DRAFT_1021748 [Mycena sanguinolenta]